MDIGRSSSQTSHVARQMKSVNNLGSVTATLFSSGMHKDPISNSVMLVLAGTSSLSKPFTVTSNHVVV
jgi:hypothetical protein